MNWRIGDHFGEMLEGSINREDTRASFREDDPEWMFERLEEHRQQILKGVIPIFLMVAAAMSAGFFAAGYAVGRAGGLA